MGIAHYYAIALSGEQKQNSSSTMIEMYLWRSQLMTVEEIPFLVSLPDEEEDQEVKGIFSRDPQIALRNIPVDRLKANLNQVCQGLAIALNDVKKVGNFKLKEVTIGVEVTVEGGVNFVGTANVEGKGAITLTFAEE